MAEILPLESADMHYCLEQRDIASGYEIGITPYTKAKRFKGKCNIVDVKPAWCLVALLHVFPYPTLHQQRDGAWGLDVWVEQVKPYSVNNAICEVDACYKMILKLHELNLL